MQDRMLALFRLTLEGCRLWGGRLLAAMVLVAAGFATPAPAQSSGGFIAEVRIGALHHDVPGLWSGFAREGHGVALNGELLLRPSLSVLGGILRPAIGGTVSTGGGTSKAYLDVRWDIEGAHGVFLSVGLGAAAHDGHLAPTDPGRKALGSRVLFHVPLEIGWRWDGRQSISIFFDHMSNGDVRRFNEGLDTLGLRYGYRF